MPETDISYSFINDLQRQAYYASPRNQLICGGFGSGKTYIYCQKAMTLATSFENYRWLVGRQTYKNLKHTTMKTFFKVCPKELYAPPLGRYSEIDGYLRLINGSEFIFMHLDEVNEDFLRGLEINGVLLDQAEEISENISDILSVRAGRWELARPNAKLRAQNPLWPMRYICTECNKPFFLPPKSQILPCPICESPMLNSGRYFAPTYFLNTCNPESETHHLYRYYHPESSERRKDHFYLEFPSTENPALDPETLSVMMSKDPQWVQRFVFGKWGISDANIHRLLPMSVIEPDEEWVKNLLRKASLCRVLDHGDAAPTCVLWFATYNGQYFCYREYYQPHTLISKHRENIAAMSEGETYSMDLADPAIFKKQSQKYGGFWCTADEYSDLNIAAPPLFFFPADNNEMPNRNRVNELLALDKWAIHPIDSTKPAPRLYFIKRHSGLPEKYGCANVINELKGQRRHKLGEINGKPMFSDEREDGVPDHAYDCLLYFVSSHMASPTPVTKKAAENSFIGIRRRMKALQMARIYDKFGSPLPLA